MAFLRAHGYGADQIYGTWENTKGTKVYFQEPAIGKSTRVVWIIARGAQQPVKVELPFGDAWIDDANHVHEFPAFVSRAGNDRIEVDPQSGYFFQFDFETKTDVARFAPDQICASGNAIILLQKRDGNTQSMFERFNNCWLFDPDVNTSGGWKRQERRLDGEPACVDPFGHRLLCYSSYGMVPMPNSLFLYDIDTGAKKNLD